MNRHTNRHKIDLKSLFLVVFLALATESKRQQHTSENSLNATSRKKHTRWTALLHGIQLNQMDCDVSDHGIK